jgi:CheY-like chemotaxis protein
MLGGEISLKSTPGEGSRFSFTLPCDEARPEAEDSSALQEPLILDLQRKLKVLIADDDEVSDMYLSLVLQPITAEFLHAANGEEAVALSKTHPDIDLILMDIKMPLMDGYEATRAIRKFNPEVVIIAQTAYAIAGDREKALEAGCTDYITKPVKADLLMKMIRSYAYDKPQA